MAGPSNNRVVHNSGKRPAGGARAVIRGTTTLIAHFGDPIAPVKAPMIYNPYFESAGIDAVVVPMGVRAADYPVTLKAVFRFTNIRGALVTMPHKVTTVGLLDDCSTTVKVAGSCNAILRRDDGTLHGDLFDGAGFVRGVERKGFPLRGARCLVVGTGGVGSAIAAALAAAGVGAIALYDTNAEGRDGLAKRLRQHYPCARSAHRHARSGGLRPGRERARRSA